MTNLHQLTLHSTTSCPTTWRSYHYYRLLWRHHPIESHSLSNDDIVVDLEVEWPYPYSTFRQFVALLYE